MIVEAIKKCFQKELLNTEKKFPGHDPFRGHTENDHAEGKSWFVKEPSMDVQYAEVESERASVDAEGKPVRIVRVKFRACYYDGRGTLYDYYGSVGYETMTRRTGRGYPDLIVENVHGCKQLVGDPSAWEAVESEICEYATVILTDGEDGDWCLASAYPGEPGESIAQLADIPEKTRIVVTGYDKVIYNGRELNTDHVVIRQSRQ